MSKVHLAAFGGIACLVLLAVFQALRETHPDAVADRHDGATDFLSRRTHESGFAHHTALFGAGGRVGGGFGRAGHAARAAPRDGALVVNPFDPTGYSDKPSLERQIAGAGRTDAREKAVRDLGRDAFRDEKRGSLARDLWKVGGVETTGTNIRASKDRSRVGVADDDSEFPEFPESLRPVSVESEEDSSTAGRTSKCVASRYKPHTEFWGAVVSPGNENKQKSADDCCASCASKRACTVFVWHPSTTECWLKTEDDPNPQPHSSGENVPWTSGVLPMMLGPTVKYALVEDAESESELREPPTCLHTVLTSSGNAYMNWQSRVVYQTYKKYASEKKSILKTFTRILHRGKDDELMLEIPTMRFDPNQAKCDHWCDYPVADRSLAVAQWSKTTNSQICSHVMMVETDYVYVKSPPPEILLPKGKAVGFEYQYIGPKEPNMLRVIREYLENVSFDVVPEKHPARAFKDVSLPRTGNAPSCLTVEDLRIVAPLWAEFVERTETPESTRKTLGWLRDMYAYDAAILIADVEHVVAGAPESKLMAQPPADDAGAKSANGDYAFNAFLLHYTWGPEIYDRDENKVWVFDKRAYGGGQYKKGPYELTKIPDPPAWDDGNNAGLQLQTFFNPRALTESKLFLLRAMIDEFNEAVEKLPRIPKGFETLEDAEKAAA